MPRIYDAHLKAVVFAYEAEADALTGARGGGTGFLVGTPFVGPGPGPDHLHIVTNEHVARTCSFFRGSGPIPGLVRVPIYHVNDWTAHPAGDDVSVAYLGLAPDVPALAYQNIRDFLTPERYKEERLGPGDEVYMIGRFIGLDEGAENTPTVRFGTLAMPDPVRVPNKYRGLDQLSFIVEMHSQSGYSGSPAYIVASRMEFAPAKPTPRPHYERLLGITWGHYPRFLQLLDPETGFPKDEQWVIADNSGMDAVVPAWTIREVLMDDGLVHARERNEQRWRGTDPDGVVPDAVS